MRIVIDLQGAQTESRFRGIGRYSLSLVLAMARQSKGHEIWLVLNGAFVDSIHDIRQAFSGLIPKERICVFDISMPLAESNPLHSSSARTAEMIREHFIERLQPHIVLITSLFEGYIDHAVTSVGRFSKNIPTAAILYDLIPLVNSAEYLPTNLQKNYYQRKIESLKKADLILSISDFSRQEAHQHLGLPLDRIVTISAGVSPSFKVTTGSNEKINPLLNRYGISKKIILSVPGGGDERKNMHALVTAYGLLPAKMRAEYQLVIAGRYGEDEKRIVKKIRKKANVHEDELITTGYISDEDLILLYSQTTLFVFPSKYEGFGLPILEAMACGVPVIGSNTTSIPEVIECAEALFDPESVHSIKNKIQEVLENEELCKRLREHGFKQIKKFTWEESAKRTIQALELQIKQQSIKSLPIPNQKNVKKKRLAFVSPLPPERTGIADYSIDLLSELSHHYEIELILNQAHLTLPAAFSKFPKRSADWFLQHAHHYDRIIYQLGNSPYHSHIYQLLFIHPGVVVLHDFFLSSLLAYEETMGNVHYMWSKALYHAHGYAALKARFASEKIDNVKHFYPCNLEVLQYAKQIIVHSDYSLTLARQWYGEQAAMKWDVIPLLRPSPLTINRAAARKALGIPETAFLVCTFGMIAPTKLNHRLLNAWVAAKLNADQDCYLFFVGEKDGSDYGEQLMQHIQKDASHGRVRVIGWSEKETYVRYLEAADVGVQLRTLSRGETSAAILDCMNYGLATIVNAHGSSASLSKEAVWMLADEFTDAELSYALETLWKETETRQQWASRARDVIQTSHAPQKCAHHYVQAVEVAYEQNSSDPLHLIKSLVDTNDLSTNDMALKYIAQSMANTYASVFSQKQLLVDVSSIVHQDLKAGIERVIRAQLLALINHPPFGYRIEPIYLSNEGGFWHYRYARQFTFKLLAVPTMDLQDDPVDVSAGDIFYALDFAPEAITQAFQAGLFSRWRALGVQLTVLVYDLLPVLHPLFFPKDAEQTHTAWLKAVTSFADCLIGISVAVADELRQWIKQHSGAHPSLRICSVPLGADLFLSAPTLGLPETADAFLEKMAQKPCFLMVGTIEPRKGYLEVIAAFETWWAMGSDAALIIVGKEGWQHLAENKRRTIPTIIAKIKHHPELNKRLFWLNDISDEYLQKIYAASTCLIAASAGEGFGLPLIEAAKHQLPIIARDIRVFREVCQQHACYFSEENLIEVLQKWLVSYENQQVPASHPIQWKTWEQSASDLIFTLVGKKVECLTH